MSTELERGEGSALRSGRSLPPGKTRYPLYRRLGGPQGRSGQVRKISPPPGFDSRTVQSVASRFTDYVTRPTRFSNVYIFKLHVAGTTLQNSIISVVTQRLHASIGWYTRDGVGIVDLKRDGFPEFVLLP